MTRRLGRGRCARTLFEQAGTTFESLEQRALLTGFVYQELGALMDPHAPLYVLRPGGDDGPIRTIGSAVDSVGDIDGDGYDDILVGAGGRTNGQQLRAVASVYSGRTGTALFTFEDGFSEFGAAVAGVGDVNGDGTPDILVGSPQFDTDEQGPPREVGRAYLYSGADGSVIRVFTGDANGDRFGAAVAGAGDFNNDGVLDLIIGAPGSDAGGEDRGRAYVYSGSDGSLIETFMGVDDDDAFGYAVNGAGDVDNDGFADVIIGAPGRFQGQQNTPGHAYVYSGQDRSLLRTITGDEDGDWLGFSVDGVGDINGDGLDDVIVGAPSAWNRTDGTVPSAGIVRIYSVGDGAVLFTRRGTAPNGNLGAAVAGAGDLNFDDRGDFIIGAPAASPEGHVGVYSGATGEQMARFSHTTSNLLGGDRLGTSVAVVGDVNNDGFVDFVFGATQDANPERNDRGRMYVFSGAGLAPLLPDGLNDDRDIWGSSGNQGFLILNGDLFLLPARDGFMNGDRVVDVNQQNTVIGGTDAAGNNSFIWVNGTRTSIADLIITEQGPAGSYTGLRAVDITDSGLVLIERLRDGNTPTAWVLDNGTLRYLFDGIPTAMNEAEMVVGYLPGDEFRSIVWTVDDGMLEVMGFRAVDVNEVGGVAGSAPGGVVVWSGGTTTPIGTIPGGSNYQARGISNSGEVIGTYQLSSGTSSFYYRPGEGIMDIKPLVTVGATPEFLNSDDLRLADINHTGSIVGGLYDVERGFLLDRFDGPGLFRGVVERRVEVTTTAGNATTVVTINGAGRIIVFRRDPGPENWTRIDLTDETGVAPASNVVVYVDPNTGSASYGAVTDDGLVLIEEDGNGGWTARNLTEEIGGSTPVVDSLFTMTPQDGLVLIGGRNAAGDVVIYGMTTATNNGARAWAYDNLFQTQLRDNGLGVPAVGEDLVVYVTPWNGLNIAGIDGNGDIRVIWTAPGVGGWRETNLSETAGTTTVVGGLTAYVTPWGGINVVGADAAGHLVVTWWVPGFEGNWEKNDFTDEFGGPTLRAESVTSYVTPWGGLNVGGVTDDGRVVMYWWVPGFGGQWNIDTINVDAADERELPARHLTSHVAPDGTFHVVGVGRFGDVLHMRWAAGEGWEVEDLS